MLIALLILSLAMIVGGLFAMILGWDIVLIERGWAMVIAGSVSASGGAILLGLVAVIGKLARMEFELANLPERTRGADLPPSPVVDPVSLVASGLLGDGGAEKEHGDEKADEPTLPLFSTEPQDGSGAAPTIGREDRFAKPRPIGPEQGPAATENIFEDAAERTGGGAEEEIPENARPEWARGTPDSEPPKPDWALDKPDDASPAPSAPPSMAPAGRPTVIGTYNSGGNRYVMFSDGSIEAETPEGTFKFGSLDELKEFIASGGESGTPT